VHHFRFRKARQLGEPEDTQLGHFQKASAHYLKALERCPASAITELGPIHNQLGNLYIEIGQAEHAREHYERRIQLAEQTDDYFRAGRARINLSSLYILISKREENSVRQHELLHRARAYAEAALDNFNHYQGRAADDEAKAQQLIEQIEQALNSTE
jgi:tetratricopeptide (TPR) repeat protein